MCRDTFVSGSKERTQRKSEILGLQPTQKEIYNDLILFVWFLQILRKSCIAWGLGCSGRRSLDWRCWGEQERRLRAMLLYLCPHMFVQSHGGSSRPWSGWLLAFWDGFGTAQAARLEERSGTDSGGTVRLFLPQHFWSVIIWRCWCSCNLALSVRLQETSAEMWIKYWGKILCIMVRLSFWRWFSFSCYAVQFPCGNNWKGFQLLKVWKNTP